MTQKPSEIIKEMLNHDYRYGNLDYDQVTVFLELLLVYLDEEYEKNKPCQHEFETKETNECIKCHLLIGR